MITQNDLDEARAFCIEAGVKAFVRQGMAPAEARERVEKAVNAPWPATWPLLPEIDDL